MKKTAVDLVTLSADALYKRIMAINVGGGEVYKSMLDASREAKSVGRMYGIRCKVGSYAEGIPGIDVVIIDPRNTKIVTAIGMPWQKIKGILSGHLSYLGSHPIYMGGVCVSGLYFKAPEEKPEASAVESGSNGEDVGGLY
jgi:hypothetical protein